jgi:FkbM family methyltransferase
MELRQVTDLVGVIWEHPANRRCRVRSLARSAGWQIWKRLIGKPFNFTIYDDVKVRCFSDGHEAGRIIYFNGWPDPAEMMFTKRFLRQGDRYIDAGANIGIYTLLAAKLVGETGHVVAFEPDLKAFSRLSGNIRDNGLTNAVTLRQAALAGAKGTAEFTAGIDSGNSLAYLAPKAARTQTVELTTLDSELGGDTYAMCKMDLEGAEFVAWRVQLHYCAREILLYGRWNSPTERCRAEGPLSVRYPLS